MDARAAGGRWLVRMEDLDSPRVLPGCASEMLRTLEAFALHWDGAVEYQSSRSTHYAQALASLAARGLTFECSCSRSERATLAYRGTCRGGPTRPGPTATRFRVDDALTVRFEDRVQGACHFRLSERGDFVVRRRDNLIAYQLAVVVDDALQGVTDVVRGADLLDNTPWQIALQQALGLAQPRYAHLPLITEPDGAKLAKSRRSVALDAGSAAAQLHQALVLLGQDPPLTLKLEAPLSILGWAVEHWDLDRLHGRWELAAPRDSS